MADKPKSKAARGKAKNAKPAEGKTAKSSDPASAAKTAPAKTTTAKTAIAKTAAQAGKKGKAKTGKVAGGSHAAKPSKPAVPAENHAVEHHSQRHVEKHPDALVETYYVCSGALPIEIRDTPPASGTQFVEFTSFADARDHFLEQLIEAIEQHERVLHAVRGAASFADYLDQQG